MQLILGRLILICRHCLIKLTGLHLTDSWLNRWSETKGLEMDLVTQRIVSETAAAERIGETSDIAPIVAFLCEEQSRWVTGSVVCANGGLVMV